jgi:hypothetical protein
MENLPENQSKHLLNGQWVSAEVYEYHQREINKLVKERDAAEQKLSVYRSLSICLIGFIVLIIYLNS